MTNSKGSPVVVGGATSADPVCCRPEITSFPGQGDRTTSCRRIAGLIRDDVRVIELVEAIHSFDESMLANVDVSIKIGGDGSIVAKPPIHSPNASGAPNNLNFRIPGGLRVTRRKRC